MSHHSDDKSLTDLTSKIAGHLESKDGQFKKDKAALLQQMKGEQLQSTLGPTGDFPAGKMAPHDEGGLMFGITNFNGRVVVDFGKPIRSLGLTRPDALQLAETLIERAKKCPPIIGEKDPI